MENTLNYHEKLRDPRWQKKRLEILQRDNWTCQQCKSTTETLVVHHKGYITGNEPWDYPDNLLITLCQPCHELEADRAAVESDLLSMIRANFLSGEIYVIADGFRRLEVSRADAFWVAETLRWILTSPEILEELMARLWREAHEDKEAK